MKSLLIGAFALGLLAGPALAAQEHHGNGGHAQNRTTTHRTVVHHPNTHTTVRRTAVRRPNTTVHRTVRTHHVAPHRTVTTRRTTTVHRGHTVRGRVTVKRGPIHLAHYHRVFRAPHRYRIGVWHAPHGFAYRRFGIGERIPAVLLAAEFFLTSFDAYGLESPPDGYVWVRDGNDAVLVDQETGEVVEVEYDVFY